MHMIDPDDLDDSGGTIPHPLFRTEITAPARLSGTDAEAIAEALDDIALSILLHNKESTDGDDWYLVLTTMGEPDSAAVKERLPDGFAIKTEKLPETDWLQHVHDNFPPVTAGRFFIYGSHYDGAPPENLVPLKIDAATAFGSGEHETTKGCMMAFDNLAAAGNDFKNALDMGCGSGILGIALMKIWPQVTVTAIDIDPESIIVTKRHANMNGVTLTAAAGDGYNAPEVPAHAPYDIIAANILAGPLIAMAPDLYRSLRPGGYAVLSGLLARQEKDVIAAHEAQGLELFDTIRLGDWRALVMRRKKV